ncbi:unnamed protein product, partial [Staurois parvus]
MGPPTDPGPSSSARVSKWSVRPWLERMFLHKKWQPSQPITSLSSKVYMEGQSTSCVPTMLRQSVRIETSAYENA